MQNIREVVQQILSSDVAEIPIEEVEAGCWSQCSERVERQPVAQEAWTSQPSLRLALRISDVHSSLLDNWSDERLLENSVVESSWQ